MPPLHSPGILARATAPNRRPHGGEPLTAMTRQLSGRMGGKPVSAGFAVLLLLGTLLHPFPAAACRYSIRDTGFVDLGAEPYHLELAVPPEFAPSAKRYLQVAAGLFLDANIRFATKDGPAAVLRMTGPDGRSLDLTAGAPLPEQPAEIGRLLESAVVSPRREDIYREALRAYAVVVLIEGTDATENERVRQAIRMAVNGIARIMPGMPKPVDIPPQLVAVPVTEQGAEAVLVWGLGLEPRLLPEARVALVYGRGRRLGAPLEGAAITRTALQERLAMIGQDCECDLDRAWLKGPVLPGRWDRELQQIAARTLGFDPENPMVRTEVSRIVLRGEGDKSRSRKPSTAFALGYTEDSVDSLEAGGEATEPVANGAAPTESTPAPVAPTVPPSAPPPPPLATPAARPLWFALFGLISAAVVTGVLVLVRSRKR